MGPCYILSLSWQGYILLHDHAFEEVPEGDFLVELHGHVLDEVPGEVVLDEVPREDWRTLFRWWAFGTQLNLTTFSIGITTD